MCMINLRLASKKEVKAAAQGPSLSDAWNSNLILPSQELMIFEKLTSRSRFEERKDKLVHPDIVAPGTEQKISDSQAQR